MRPRRLFRADFLLIALLSTGLIGCAASGAVPTLPTLANDRIAQIVASTGRGAADRANDIRRHPSGDDSTLIALPITCRECLRH